MADAITRAAAHLGPRVQRDVALGPMTTYRVGGAAALFFAARDEEDLVRVRAAVMETDVPVLVVGGGSNLLVADAGWPGLAITLEDRFATIEVLPDAAGTRVRAGAAVALPVLARRHRTISAISASDTARSPGWSAKSARTTTWPARTDERR